MGKIVILDEKTANQIAAGEVIERPASVIKEMVENAVDAGATAIAVEIRNGGIPYIRVTDNGGGMESDDVEMAFERHATSKIRKIEDLDTLTTMGFRGEALASIAAVSRLEVRTKTRDAQTGTLLRIEGGKVAEETQTGCPAGTTFIIRDLFFNTPARYKFLKKDSTEAGYVSDMMVRLALAHPEISFKFVANNQVQHHTPGNNDLLSVIYSIYGNETARSVIPITSESPGVEVSGFIGKPEIARGTRSSQSFFLNGRNIRNKVVTSALEDAYKTVLMQNKYPFCVINLRMSPFAYDVNVHPQKLEVRFSNESAVYTAVFHAVKDALAGTSLIREAYGHPAVSPAKPVAENTPGAQIRIDVEQGTVLPVNKETSQSYGQRPFAYSQPDSQAAAIKPQMPSIPEKAYESFKKAEIHVRPEYETHGKIQLAEEAEVIGMRPDNKPRAEEAPALGEAGIDVLQAVGESGTDKLQEENILAKAEIVGQVFDTYIILQHGENMYLIDQHAAHERIRYESLKKRISEGVSCSQSVMEPYVVKLSPLEYDFLFSRMEAFEKIGFEIEEFGRLTVIITSIPDIFEGSFTVSDFHEILDRWMETHGDKTAISDDAVYMMSCKSAIKANRHMYREEMAALVRQLCFMENPYTCVHGRPVIVSIPQRELEKKFKRIV